MIPASHAQLRSEVERHYETLLHPYLWLWGEHLHHGYWDGPAPPRRAQERLVEELAAFARVPEGARLVDVGCGVGGSARWLARRRDCRVLGLSISHGQLREARRRSRGGWWVRADAARLPLRDAVCDAVWIVECSEHLLDRDGLWRECARVTRPGGRLALAAWLRGPHAPPEATREVEEGFLTGPLPRADDLLGELAAAGWRDADWREVTGAVRPTWDHCLTATRGLMVRRLLDAQPEPVRRFVAAFGALREAYATGRMQYGLFRAVREGGA